MRRITDVFKGEFAYHILLWLLLIGPHSFFSSYLIDDHLDLLLYCIAVADLLLIVFIYIIFYALIPRMFLQGRYVPFGLWMLLLFSGYIAACLKMESDISIAIGRDHNNIRFVVYYFINICRYTLIGFLLFRLRQHFEQKKKLNEMSLQKLNAEVKYLRAQINPHFLFNTLNNLYGLALDGSKKTTEVIVRLSKMMDYMLYEAEGTRVPLKRDVENLENYIEMERIRQGNNAVIHFQVTGDLAGKSIEPLLMLPLVENAFKHGVNQMIEGAHLHVDLLVVGETLIFTVNNNYKKRNEASSRMHQSLGLKNLKNRLNLFYPGRYTLDVHDDAVDFKVTLKLMMRNIENTSPISSENFTEHEVLLHHS